jgi:hypothetical protein
LNGFFEFLVLLESGSDVASGVAGGSSGIEERCVQRIFIGLFIYFILILYVLGIIQHYSLILLLLLLRNHNKVLIRAGRDLDGLALLIQSRVLLGLTLIRPSRDIHS